MLWDHSKGKGCLMLLHSQAQAAFCSKESCASPRSTVAVDVYSYQSTCCRGTSCTMYMGVVCMLLSGC